MTEREVMRLMRAVHELDVKEREERYVQERAACLSLPRLRTALLREDWTATEREHIGHCPYCQKAREKVQRTLWHPEKAMLVNWTIGQRGGEDEEAVRVHLEEERCSSCMAYVQYLERVRTLGLLCHIITRLQVSRLGTFAPEEQPPFLLEVQSDSGRLVATLHETPDHDLELLIEVTGPSLLISEVEFIIVGEQGERVGTIALREGFVAHPIGQRAEVEKEIGEVRDLKVYPAPQ